MIAAERCKKRYKQREIKKRENAAYRAHFTILLTLFTTLHRYAVSRPYGGNSGCSLLRVNEHTAKTDAGTGHTPPSVDH